MTALLAHAVTRSSAEAPDRGLRGLPLRPVVEDDLALWATAWEAPERALTRDDALAHHELVVALCGEDTCLPVRFGTWLRDEPAAREHLRQRAAELGETLARVHRRRELAVTLLWTDAPAGVSSPEGRGAGPGGAYLRARAGAMATDAGRRRAAEEAARRLRERLSVEQADAWHEICPSARVAVSLSLLVPLDRAEALRSAAIGAAQDIEGVRPVVSGPWPPYTFAGLR